MTTRGRAQRRGALLLLSMVGTGLPVVLAAPADAAPLGIISNGTVQMGVRAAGDLNVPGGPTSPSSFTSTVGLRYVPTGNESTAAGCTCEGWGVADRLTGASGYANSAIDGVRNLQLESFTADADSATSVVKVLRSGTPVLRVTHDYQPSTETANLYEVTVSIENLSGAVVDPQYRRVMDWDAEPTAFREYVTIQGTAGAADLKGASNGGFSSANPLAGDSGDIKGDFVDAGPRDHGALFDFDFADLAPGATKTFTTYYGAAGSEDAADAALQAVGAEVYSYGQPSSAGGKEAGTPNTFVFAFGGVGGAPAFEPVNTAPVASAGGPYSVPEGGSTTLTASATDAEGDAVTYAWDLDGDGDFDDASSATTSFSAAALDGPTSRTVRVRATDAQGASSTADATVAVTNVAPAVAFTGSESVQESGTYRGSGSITDPAPADVLTGTVDYGDGTVEPLSVRADGTFDLSHVYADDAPSGTASDAYTVTVSVSDDDGGTGSATRGTTVTNAAPDAGDIAFETAPVPLGRATTVRMPFTDAGAADSHSAVITWDDGTTSAGTVAGGVVTGSHTYTTPGVYTISIAVTDDDTGTDTSTTNGYVVVFNAAGGSVTGGGHLVSPAGAYAADPTMTGKAAFGFVSQYKKGATVPTGNTEFQFHAGSLTFSSTSYDFLVVAGSKAQYKGRGTVNGKGDHTFLVTAVDGSPDRFRIKISDRATGALVYDNQVGQAEDSDSSTAISGGSIVIHK